MSAASPRNLLADLIIGIDHVGISSDFDGGGGVDGWRNASESLNVTAELVRRGYSKSEIAKIWGGNLLRVMERVEKAATAVTRGAAAAPRVQRPPVRPYPR